MAFRGSDRGRGRGGGSAFGRGGAYQHDRPTLSCSTNFLTPGFRGGYSNSNYGPPAAIIGKNGHKFFLEPGEIIMDVDAPSKMDTSSLPETGIDPPPKMTADQLRTQPWKQTH